MRYLSEGGTESALHNKEVRFHIHQLLQSLGERKKVLVIPPDFTRYHSMAGIITQYIWEYYGDSLAAILPALGTHAPMTCGERTVMFGKIPDELFHTHNWRKDLLTLGTVPGSFIKEVSEGKLDYDWPAQLNRLVVEGNFDLVISVGQVVPHEVAGMANFNKNVFIGTGGREGINKSHFLGAVYGMERMMGRVDTPVRKVLNYASSHFLTGIPLLYIHTVVGRDEAGELQLRGIFAGDDEQCFLDAAHLSLQVNFQLLEKPLLKIVVYLDPAEYKSTWLGNKSIYRTRMAIADGGELLVLAPGLREFGEDSEIDRIIRKYGYVHTDRILELTREQEDLVNNLSAAAHLIHGSSENRFSITYCTGHISREEMESVNFAYAPLDEMLKKYDPATLCEGMNIMPGGEEVFFISNPALGLWALKERFMNP